MALHPGFPAVTLGANQFDTRASLSSLVFTDSSGNVRSGVIPPVAASLVTGRADMMVAVGQFNAAISRAGGPVFLSNDGTIKSPALAAAPAANSRIDLIYVQQKETAAPVSDSADGSVIGVVTGVVAATPTAPVTPAGALPLATVTIPSGATATNNSGVVISQVFPYTAIGGGPLLVRSFTELASITTAVGQRATDLSTNITYSWAGTAWVPEKPLSNSWAILTDHNPGAVFTQAGSAVVTFNTAGRAGITFPKPFASGIDSVVVTNGDSLAYPPTTSLAIVAASTNLAQFWVYGNAGMTCRVNWIAVGS